MESWRTIPASKGKIEISDKGNIRSLLRGEPFVLKCQEDASGYYRVRATIERQKMTFKIHREVAKAFIPNPNNLPQVNHKDGNKKNNAVDNLEWVTNQENAQHAIRMGLWDSVIDGAKKENERRKIPIVGYCNGEVKHFASISEAERYVNSRHVTAVLKGKRSHTKGWTFVRGGDADDRFYD